MAKEAKEESKGKNGGKYGRELDRINRFIFIGGVVNACREANIHVCNLPVTREKSHLAEGTKGVCVYIYIGATRRDKITSSLSSLRGTARRQDVVRPV